MNENRILPPGGQFHAVVNGGPAALAGCDNGACDRANCLRRDASLRYRVNLSVPNVADCRAYIPLVRLGV